MRTHAEVVVIGGGAVGTAILFHLAKAGITDTVLIEKNELTAGSTWHAAGNIPTYANSWLGMRAGNYAWSLYKEMAEDPEAPITYRHTSAIWPAHTPERMQLFQHLCGVSRSAGFELSMLSPAEIEQMHPYWHADDSVLGGILDPYEGDIDPSQLTQALAKHARALGAEVRRFTRVTGLSQRPNGEWEVHTPAGVLVAGTVINAAGSSGAKVAAMAGLHLPVVTLEHQYMVTTALPQLEEDTELFPLIRDPDIRFYLRRERNALLLGSYAHEGRPVWQDGVPEDFDHQLFADDIDGMMEVFEAAASHVPILAEAGAQRFVNGPIPYAPDALPLVGPAGGVRNFYHATGVQIGITHSAAIGKAIAEWLTEGETEWDLSAWDPRRFGNWATQDYAAARASEHYDLQYAIPYPRRIMSSGRAVNQTPLYDHLRDQGAVMGQIGGWERAFWFQRDDIKDTGELSFGHEPWQDAVRLECETVRDAVGIMDHGGFTKYVLEGPDAADVLNRLVCGALPPVGRVRLSYMLTPKGCIWSEATIARLAEDRFLLCGPTLAVDRDFDWVSQYIGSANAILSQGYDRDGALLVMGPRSRDLLLPLTSADLNAPWMSVAEIEIAGISVTALRVSYVGELGWELHVASDDLVTLYNTIWQAGAEHGICNFGSYALNAMRIEKGYHGWGADFGTEYTLYDAGLSKFANLSKGEFLGRDAVFQQGQTDAEWEFIGLEINDPGPEPMPSDPIIKDGKVIGYLTSVSMGYRTGKLLALGYVEHGKLAMTESCHIQAFGELRTATRHSHHVYDPDNIRLRA
ncbi:FAD-dependent oxidoreductase [Ruegeria sp. Ofav3-42]|uniref:GcvT family protein n=1 Tax=Ruegeria sp. Ofav3-42 TaxID=2917759 RepID=UPI001EF42615|nr:FAD-dependent oxidoreductase [Ruegeria sp. Ofav3-42]MCG7522661.1 FAD-dependent oxidoreductase [Ruegeria sp. Ofav3-42]